MKKTPLTLNSKTILVSDTLVDQSTYQLFCMYEPATISPLSFIQLSNNDSEITRFDTLCILSLGIYPLLSLLNAVQTLLSLNGLLFIHSEVPKHYQHTDALLERLGFKSEVSDFTTASYQSWRKVRSPTWQIKAALKEHQSAISTLFVQTFKHPLSSELWRWKYNNDRGHAVLAFKENILVGHYGAMVRDIYIAHQPAKALQIGDVMIAKSERSVFSKRGLFFQICATFLEQYIGEGKPYALGYGFPTERAMRIAQHQGLYQKIDRMVEKHWSPLNSRSSIFHAISPLNSSASIKVQSQIAILWESMLRDFSQAIIGVRDWNYLYHRYFNRPEKAYQLYRVNHRLTNKPVGIIVLSVEGERCRLMDLIGTQQAFPCLIHHARRISHHLNVKQLFAWTTLSHQDLWPCNEGQPIDICIPSNAWTPQSKLASASNQWWLTAGDTDFC